MTETVTIRRELLERIIEEHAPAITTALICLGMSASGATPHHPRRPGKIMDVGACCIGYKPISLDEVVERLKNKPNLEHH